MLKIFVILLLSSTLISCIMGNTENFSLKISLEDSDGNPMENIRITFLNMIEFDYLNQLQGSTIIAFSLAESCHVELCIEDINRDFIKNLISDDLESGYYNQMWDGSNENEISIECGIYYCVLKTFQDNLLQKQFEKMIYMMNLNSEHRNGITNSNGMIEFNKKNPFLNLQDIYAIELIDINGNFDGYESISDTTMIYFFNPINNSIQTEFVQISNSRNVFNFIWDSNYNKEIQQQSYNTLVKSKCKNLRTLETKLVGNYPNPF